MTDLPLAIGAQLLVSEGFTRLGNHYRQSARRQYPSPYRRPGPMRNAALRPNVAPQLLSCGGAAVQSYSSNRCAHSGVISHQYRPL
jgi:hypothetical protein